MTRGIWHYQLDTPAWYIFGVAPMKELPAEAWLIRNGALDAWHPVEKRWKPCNAKRAKVPYFAPFIAGYTFVRFDREPHWDVLFDRANGKLSYVISSNGIPMRIPETVIAQMAQVPERMRLAAEAEAEARKIKPGDKATFTRGNVEWSVEVTSITNGMASFILPLMGGARGVAPIDKLEKVTSPLDL